MIDTTPIKLRIPEQDLAQVSLFEASAAGARTWGRGLPMANAKEVAQQLRQAIEELNRVAMPPDVRFAILEQLRPKLYTSLASLSAQFLNQPIVLPEVPRQLSELADTLYGHMATAYIIAAIHAIQQRDSIREVNPAQLVCESLQRALDILGRKLLQSYQLYQPIEQNFWLELHQLYALAERQQLARLPVSDKHTPGGSIAETYVRALLLACCKPNQLRQSDLAGIHRGLQDWGEHMHLEDPDTGDGLFQIDLSSDRPPMYSVLFTGATNTNTRFIDTAGLIEHLTSLKNEFGQQGKPGITFDKNNVLASNILDHLISSLGTMSKRNFSRTAASNDILITLGLSNAHYYISGGLTFNQLLHGADSEELEETGSNPFMVPTRHHDAWEQANPHEEPLQDAADYTVENINVDDATRAHLEHEGFGKRASERHRAYPVKMIDSSPGGYCLEWSPDLPGDIKTGDIISVRDGENADWLIAVARWVSQLPNARTLIGIELLSPKAMPYGARVVQISGRESELMRVLLLPEIKLVGQPHTLITPRAGFRERQKVSLVREGEHFYLQLLRQVAATGSFAQFDFRYIKLLEDVIAEDKSGPLGATYDSLWTNI